MVVADTGPLLAAANRRDRAHALAAALVTQLGRQLVVPDPVIVESDHLLRRRVGLGSARLLLDSLAEGELAIGYATPGLVRRAVEIDRRYRDLDLGFCDGFVMAYAERHRAPVLTFDFAHYRATRPEHGHWRLVVDEARYDASLRR
jgi:predicted nucleic acid-binding protein